MSECPGCEKLEAECESWERATNNLAKKLSEAEAELESERFKHDLDHKLADQWKARAEQAEAENERMRVCGTCGHCGWHDAEQGAIHIYCNEVMDNGTKGSDGYLYFPMPLDTCIYPKSRWTPYWEEP